MEEDWITLREESLNWRREYFAEWIEWTRVLKEEPQICEIGKMGIIDAEQELHELARSYWKRCNDYDHDVCSGYNRKTRERTPRSGYEHALILKNSWKIFDEIAEEGRGRGFTREQIRQAIRECAERGEQ